MRGSSIIHHLCTVGMMLLLTGTIAAQATEPVVLARERLAYGRSPGEIVIDVDPRARQRIVEHGRGVVLDFPLSGRAPVDLELQAFDVLCNKTYGYGVSTFPGNGDSWEKDMTAHEIGHNFSSPHTHCFVPEIDICANQAGCHQGTTQQTVGMIMSYCSQKQSTFDQRVRDERIRPAAEDAYPACVTTAGLPGAVDDGSGNGLIAPGRPIRLLVYADPAGSGDPANATLVHSEDTTVQVVSAGTWNSYALGDGVMIASGDYYIGVYDLEADTADSYIGSRDTSREGDSWQAANSTSPFDFGAHTGATWMIRGAGGSVPAGTIKLDWQPACNEATTPDQDFAVYAGAIGSFQNLTTRTCSTSRATSLLMDGVQDGSFLIVVPQTSANEGSYGRDGDSLERVPATEACRPQQIGSCL